MMLTFIRDHFILYLTIMVILGFMLGVIFTYIVAMFTLASAVFSMLAGGYV